MRNSVAHGLQVWLRRQGSEILERSLGRGQYLYKESGRNISGENEREGLTRNRKKVYYREVFRLGNRDLLGMLSRVS